LTRPESSGPSPPARESSSLHSAGDFPPPDRGLIGSNGIFFGWAIVAVMWLVNFSAMATGNLSFKLFVIPMGDALGMSRSQLGWAITARRIGAGVSSFFVGRLIDRYGPRVLIPTSVAIIGVALIGVNRANAPWQILALFGFAGMTGLAAPRTSRLQSLWPNGPAAGKGGWPWPWLPPGWASVASSSCPSPRCL